MLNGLLFYYSLLSALKFKVEPSNVVVSSGNSVLLPCEGDIDDLNQGKNSKHSLYPNIRWRGPDGQDIGIDTIRYVLIYSLDVVVFQFTVQV